MFIKHIAHRILLIAMFLVCVLGVVLFVKQKADASSTLSAATTGVENTVSTAGVCSAISGTTVASQPVDNLCKSGTPSAVTKNVAGWEWRCMGSNNVASELCSVIGANPTATQNTTSTTATVAKSDSTAISQTTSNASAATTEIKKDSSTTVKTTQETGKNDGQNYAVTATLEQQGGITKPDTAVTKEEQAVVQNAAQASVDEQSPIIAAPVVIEAKNLSQSNNPKISGVVDESLKIEKVVLVNKDNGSKLISLSGKAGANAIVVIYIFSNDPVVISIKADANGSWNYELDKELADGQHEAYVAVTDDAGKIVTKSQPIAFVKTAEAASMIPVSELKDNQSPMESSTQQFVLMAIIVMSICLVIALAAIGFLTHRRNFNERRN